MNKKTQTKKALSLFEVIIVLAITSMTIVTSVGLLSRNVRMIKNNEMEDFMNGTLLKAVEAVKSPNLVSMSNASAVSTAGKRYFTLTKAIDNVYYLDLKQGAVPLTKTNCNTGSVFYKTGEAYPYCMQLVITTVINQASVKFYNIQAVIVFTLDGNSTRLNSINLYRYADFQSI